MNNKGQVLVIFVVLIPIILTLVAYVFDKCYLLYENKKLSDIANIVCDYSTTSSNKESVYQLALENDSEISKVELDNDNLILEKNVNSIFGKVIGISEYLVKIEKECK
jgi:Flp pilus assembly protein TadG